MIYIVALSNSSQIEPVFCEYNGHIEIGERVLLQHKGKKVLGYVIGNQEWAPCDEFLPNQKSSSEYSKIIERMDYISFLEKSRVKALYSLANFYFSGLGKYFDISFPSKFDDYFSLFVESVSPFVNIEKMPYEEFKKIKNYKEYINNGLVKVYRDFETKKPRPRKRGECVYLKISSIELSKLKLTVSQSTVVNYLLLKGPTEVEQIIEDLDIKKDVIVQLKNKGIIEILEQCSDFETLNIKPQRVILSDEQKSIVDKILSYDFRKEKKHLVFGPTGSGKTEVYLEVIEKYLPFGNVLYLVPEVSLTEQTIARLRKRFPDLSIAVYHSYLTESKRVDIWAKAVKGEINILVGPRSAAFVPLKNLNLAIVDEEHDEGYYNNSEPFYEIHAFLDALPITVVYGSATPSLESYKKAKDGEYVFHKLTKRYNVELPEVEIVDMNKTKKVTFSISEILYNNLSKVLEADKSAIIFTRRKGFSRVQCAVCGYIVKCEHCDVAMTYHLDSNNLKCHICGSEKELSLNCPNCGSNMFIDRGTGSEKVEKELQQLFPSRNIGRIDAEIADTPEKLKKLLDYLREGKIDIVAGTKMITKGLDIYRIALIGVVDVDALISYPDMNAPLRTFQLLVQVIGRAGRSEKGKAIIQTYKPTDPVITFASNQDVEGFYERELEIRKQLNYPPFASVVVLTYANLNQEIARETIDTVADEIENIVKKEKKVQEVYKYYLELLGPSEHPIFKANNKYRYQIFFKTNNVPELVRLLKKIISNYSGEWIIKVNPNEI